jgi:hypothetical protein
MRIAFYMSLFWGQRADLFWSTAAISRRNMHTEEKDADAGKGAVEQDKPGQADNTSLRGQLPHRPENAMIDSNDTDFPEPGENPEHSGEREE